jgi:hypothetical protein
LWRFAGVLCDQRCDVRVMDDPRKLNPELRSPVWLVNRTGRPPDPTRRCAVEVRRCRRHGLTEFAYYSAGRKRGRRWCCKRCVGEAVTRRHQKLKRILVHEAGNRCAVCGYDRSLLNLHFHHVDPTTKEFEVNTSRGKSIAAYRQEAKKCVLVCANCHGEIEAALIESPPPGAKYRGRPMAA